MEALLEDELELLELHPFRAQILRSVEDAGVSILNYDILT